MKIITTGDNQIVLCNYATASAHIRVDWTVTSDKRDKTDDLKTDNFFVKFQSRRVCRGFTIFKTAKIRNNDFSIFSNLQITLRFEFF